MGISEEKADLRTRYRHERSERYLEHSFEHLADSAEFAKAKMIASYISYADEPDTRALNLQLINQGKILLLPRIAGKNLEWVRWDGDESQISKAKKIAEPIGQADTELGNVELIVVPALRIDRSGYRLGQGGGYYDRVLSLVRPDVPIIAEFYPGFSNSVWLGLCGPRGLPPPVLQRLRGGEGHIVQARGGITLRVGHQLHEQHAVKKVERPGHTHTGCGQAVERIHLGALPGGFLFLAAKLAALGHGTG